MTTKRAAKAAPVFPEDVREDFQDFVSVLADAYRQTAQGKGEKRHGGGLTFQEQPIITDPIQVGHPGGLLFQGRKKSTESEGMFRRGELDACYRELLGSIVYTAAAALYVRSRIEEEK